MTPLAPDEAARIIVLARGSMDDGGQYWCYVAIKPSRHKEFQQAVLNQYNIQNFASDGYGEVIVSGKGDMPPDDITLQVANLFGVAPESLFTDPNPDATLAEKLAKLQSEE